MLCWSFSERASFNKRHYRHNRKSRFRCEDDCREDCRRHRRNGEVHRETTVHGLKDAGKGADLAGKEGGHVIVHTVGEGADKTAHSVEWVGDKTVHTTEGTVEDVGKGSKTVAVKTADGTKETFEVADHATVDTGKDVARYSARGAKKGEHVTVYYTEEAGKKIAHVFKHL